MSIMETKMFKCCFAGHGEIYDSSLDEKIIDAAIKLIEECNVNEFWVGNYGEFDRLSASVVRKLKKVYPHIRIVLVLPYLTKEINEHGKEFKENYDTLVMADIQPNTPARYRILKANEYMVNECGYVMAYVKHSWGGAAKTLAYAQKKQKRIINIAKDFEVL